MKAIAIRACLAGLLAMVGSAAGQNRYSNPDTAAANGDRYDMGDPLRPTRVAAILKSLVAAASKRDWITARAKLIEARAVPDPNTFDLFEIEVEASFVAINTGDHDAALASYRKVTESSLFGKALTPLEQRGTLRNAMILSNEIGDFSGSVALGERLEAMGALDDSAATALAVAYFGNKDYAKARALARQAIDAANAAGHQPDPSVIEIASKTGKAGAP